MVVSGPQRNCRIFTFLNSGLPIFALKWFKESIIYGKHVKIMIDNTIAVAAINNHVQAPVL